jgi:hypothetical protein
MDMPVQAEEAPIRTMVSEEDLDATVVFERKAEVGVRSDHTAIEIQRKEMEANKMSVAASRTGGMNEDTALLFVPQPQIGMQAYEQYLKEAMMPLKNEECSQTNGVVEIEFTLKAGKPTDFIIKQSFCDAANKETIRLIENGSKWTGEDGQTVVLKVNF